MELKSFCQIVCLHVPWFVIARKFLFVFIIECCLFIFFLRSLLLFADKILVICEDQSYLYLPF